MSQHPEWVARRGGPPVTKYGLRRKTMMKSCQGRPNLEVAIGGWMDDPSIAALARVAPAA